MPLVESPCSQRSGTTVHQRISSSDHGLDHYEASAFASLSPESLSEFGSSAASMSPPAVELAPSHTRDSEKKEATCTSAVPATRQFPAESPRRCESPSVSMAVEPPMANAPESPVLHMQTTLGRVDEPVHQAASTQANVDQPIPSDIKMCDTLAAAGHDTPPALSDFTAETMIHAESGSSDQAMRVPDQITMHASSSADIRPQPSTISSGLYDWVPGSSLVNFRAAMAFWNDKVGALSFNRSHRHKD